MHRGGVESRHFFPSLISLNKLIEVVNWPLSSFQSYQLTKIGVDSEEDNNIEGFSHHSTITMEVEKLQKEAKDKKKKDDDSDFITDIIGQFGPFHAVTYSIMGLSLMIHCWQMMVNKFYTYKTDFYCARPPDLNHWSLDQWRNLSAPKVLDDYDRCTTFHVNYSTIEIRPQENTTLLSCNAWEYDTEYFEQTIIQRWDMVCGNYNNFPRLVQIVFFFGNMCGVLAIGPLSDWYGRKTAYLTALTIWSGITIIGYFVNHPYLWIATRFIAGASSLAYNTVSDLTKVGKPDKENFKTLRSICRLWTSTEWNSQAENGVQLQVTGLVNYLGRLVT